jgi:glycosyltransferase involved in cell wall biosynthesis
VGNAVVVEKEKRENYGIAEDRFVILLVGNRLEQEVTEDFLKKIYVMLEENPKAVIAVIGNCGALEKRIAEAYRRRVYFLGYTEELQKTMTIGDLFLNPPRQGGGTGAMYAILQEIPVVTLDNCDVQVNVGETFACDSTDSMISLVHQYCEDEAFMEKRKEACHQKAEEIFAVDEKENYRKLCEFVEAYTLEQEKQADSR